MTVIERLELRKIIYHKLLKHFTSYRDGMVKDEACTKAAEEMVEFIEQNSSKSYDLIQ